MIRVPSIFAGENGTSEFSILLFLSFAKILVWQTSTEYLWAAQSSPATEGCSSGTRPTRPRLLPTPLPTPPPPLSSPPPSLDDRSRAGQKRPADDKEPHTTTRWSPKVPNQRGFSSGLPRPAPDTNTLTDDSRQQYTHPTYGMGPRTEQKDPMPPRPTTSPATHPSPAQHTNAITPAAGPGDMGPRTPQHGPTPPKPPRARGPGKNKRRRGCNGGQRQGGTGKNRDLGTVQPGI